MKTLPRLRSLRLATASLFVLTACAVAQPPAPDTTVSLWQKIQSANTNLSCDNSSQCHTLGVGAKACGGPENYIAWSSKNSDGSQLKALVEQHAVARRADDAREHMMSTCSVISDPGASCKAGQCVLNSRSLLNPPNSQ